MTKVDTPQPVKEPCAGCGDPSGHPCGDPACLAFLKGMLLAFREIERRLVWWETNHETSIKMLEASARKKSDKDGSTPSTEKKKEYWMEQGGLASVKYILHHARRDDIEPLKKLLGEDKE